MMTHAHEHPPRAVVAQPTMSLLRLSGGQRVAGALAIVALLWLCVVAVMGGAT